MEGKIGCGHVVADRVLRKPITGIAACCARAASGHAAAAPLNSVMKSRRFTEGIRGLRRRWPPYPCRAEQGDQKHRSAPDPPTIRALSAERMAGGKLVHYVETWT